MSSAGVREMAAFLIVAGVVLVVMVVVTLVRRRREAEWYGIPAADRKMIMRAVRRGEAVADKRLTGQARQRAEKLVALRKPGRLKLYAGLFGALALLAGLDAAVNHDWEAAVVTVSATICVLAYLYELRHHASGAAQRAVALNRSDDGGALIS